MSLVTINWNPPREQLRSFGWIALGVFGLLGGLTIWRQHILFIQLQPATALTVAYALWGLGVLCAVLAVCAPKALWPLFVGLMCIGMPIGFVLTHVIMALVFYGVLTPIGLVFRLMGRDALQRRLEPAAGSYWQPRERVTDVKRYFRQF